MLTIKINSPLQNCPQGIYHPLQRCGLKTETMQTCILKGCCWVLTFVPYITRCVYSKIGKLEEESQILQRKDFERRYIC